MLTVDALKAYGANVREGLGRCLNNEGFYLRLVRMAAQDASFNKLYDAIDAGDLDRAFEAAHALKGVLGNLALDPLLVSVNEMTELLRARTEIDYGPYISLIQGKHQELMQLCQD